ncbi:hypothetical protein KUD11_05730 [Roseovarius sp. LXJ103]|uniref:hypothetical protein n=1 Tax=Roseovarius carneus TaxID=2853164 RepID=UPI000D60B771|nr:hypothetical protein [Roseovarius carneus]MBZ8118143.1 hypothetical protein [Roseovarius carneus]PWE36124.1 hypothetical protein DD563_09235 [Pelagicola sp. LXJ1103]
MSGKFISLIVAASMAVTGFTAAPAAAGDRDVVRALAAIAGIAIIGAAIHEQNKSQQRRAHVSTRSHNNHGYHQPRKYKQAKHYNHAYQKGYNAHRREVRQYRQQRRAHQQWGYSARPYYGY